MMDLKWYIYFDLASLTKVGGVFAFSHFLERYRESYLPDVFPPIFIKAREATSYRFLRDRHFKYFEQFLGVKLTIEELCIEPRGADIMHHLLLSRA